MTTATLESPPPSDQLDLITHSFNADGDCLDPERLIIKMPKGCTCELRLANCESWHIGYQLAAGKEGAVDVYPSLNVIGYSSRFLALEAAFRVAVEFFEASPKSKAHRKCAGEVHAFIIALRGGSPANKPSARVPLPEPKPMDLDLARLEANPHNPRGAVDQDAADIEELAETIKTVGLLQPIGVRILSDDQGLPGIGENRLQLLWGHRRLAAFQRLKRDTIPARVYEGITDEQARLLLLIENGQQKQLDPIQEARGYAEMVRDFELTQDDVAKVVKKSRPVVANALRLLDLPEKVQELIAKGAFTTAHGTALASYSKFPAVCEVIAEHVLENNLSAGEIEDHFLAEDELRRRKLIVKCPTSYVVPKVMSWAFRDAYSAIGCYCLDLDLWKTEAARLVLEKKEERAAAKRREEKAEANTSTATSSAKKKVLTPEDGSVVSKEHHYLLDLVDAAKIAKGQTYHGDKCTLVLDKALWSSIDQARKEVILEDVLAKATPLIAAGWKRAETLKKMDGFAAACLLMCPEFKADSFTGSVAQRLGLDRLGKHAKRVLATSANRWDGERVTIKVNELVKVDALDLARLALGLRCEYLEDLAVSHQSQLTSEVHWLRFVSGSEAPGFLDESKPKDQDEIRRRVADILAPKPGDTVEWERNLKRVQGTVLERAAATKEAGYKFSDDVTPVRPLNSNEIASVFTNALLVVVRLGTPADTSAKKSAKKGGKKK